LERRDIPRPYDALRAEIGDIYFGGNDAFTAAEVGRYESHHGGHGIGDHVDAGHTGHHGDVGGGHH